MLARRAGITYLQGMNCSLDHSAPDAGSFCTECGEILGAIPAASAKKNPLAQMLSTTQGKAILGGSLVGLLIIAFLGVSMLTKSSPAEPYLITACERLNPIDFGKQNKDDNETLLSDVESDIDTAANLDAGTAAPFKQITSDLETIISATDANNTQFAIMLTLKNYSNIKSIQDELDRIIALGDALEVDIDTACSAYTTQ